MIWSHTNIFFNVLFILKFYSWYNKKKLNRDRGLVNMKLTALAQSYVLLKTAFFLNTETGFMIFLFRLAFIQLDNCLGVKLSLYYISLSVVHTYYFFLFLSQNVIFQSLLSKVSRKYLFFSSNFDFVTWAMKFSNLPIFQNILGRFSFEWQIENFLELLKRFCSFFKTLM